MKTKMKKIIVMLLCVLSVLSLCSCNKKTDAVRIGTGGTSGVYDSVGRSLAEIFSENSVDTELKTTAGSAANIRLLSEGYLDLAIAQEDIANDAYNATGSFEGSEQYRGYSAVAELYTEAVQIVVRADSDIRSVNDLSGKKISLGEQDSGSEKNAVQILDIYGISTDMITCEHMNYEQEAAALSSGEIDAFFLTGGTNIDSISGLQNIRLVSIDASKVNDLVKKYSFYHEYIIPAGTYAGINTDTVTVGVKSMLFASDKLSREKVRELTEIIFANEEKLQQGVPTQLDLVKPDSSDGFSVNLHSGANSYYTNAQSVCKYTFSFDMYQTIFIAVIVLFLGSFLKKRIEFLRKFCIPAPVVGGLIFAVLTLILYTTRLVEISFDDTLREVCMVMFFTSVGFQANMKVLKSGGKSLIVFLLLLIVLIVGQNAIAIGLSKALGLPALVGLCTGSIPMVGGHGTAGAFGPVLEDFGINGATTVCTAAATFGLITGSIIGGPIGNRLISKKHLKPTEPEDDSVLVEDEEKHARSFSNYAPAVFQLVTAIGIGTLISYLLSLTGMTFPIYIGAMIAAAIIRNIGEYSGKITVHMGEINDIGGICLSLFLGIAMIMLKLWQLADLALPLLILLAGQTVFMFVFAYFIVFRVMGADYDAAVITSGVCGFGMGATPNAMANMQAICDKYYPSIKAYLIIPIVGSLFADFLNSLVITLFINIV